MVQPYGKRLDVHFVLVSEISVSNSAWERRSVWVTLLFFFLLIRSIEIPCVVSCTILVMAQTLAPVPPTLWADWNESIANV
jgi:hypothetical protein